MSLPKKDEADWNGDDEQDDGKQKLFWNVLIVSVNVEDKSKAIDKGEQGCDFSLDIEKFTMRMPNLNELLGIEQYLMSIFFPIK